MRKDVLERRAKPGMTQRRVLAILRESDESADAIAAKAGIDKTSAFKVLRSLVEKGCAFSYDEPVETTRKWERSVRRMYRWAADLPDASPTAAARREYHKQYRAEREARKAAGLPEKRGPKKSEVRRMAEVALREAPEPTSDWAIAALKVCRHVAGQRKEA